MCNKPKIKNTPAPVAATPVAAPETTTVADVDTATESRKRRLVNSPSLLVSAIPEEPG